MLAKPPEHRHASMEEVLSELESITRRPRTRWKEALRTPSAGAMTVRRPLVIHLEKTVVDRVGLRERLWHQCKRSMSARAARIVVIACAGVIAGGSLLLSTRLFLGNSRAPTAAAAPASPVLPATRAPRVR
jgi:hypothetical protein